MSYEGYSEWLCEKGHYQTSDAYEDDPTTCRKCGAKLVWSHAVDQTNGELYDDDGKPVPGTHPYPLEKIGETTRRITVKEPIYRIPSTPSASHE